MAAPKKAAETQAEAPQEDVDAQPSDTVEEAAAPEKATSSRASDVGTAAWRRSDDLRALEEERDACKGVGKDDRVKDIEAQIKRLKSAPVGRTEPKRS